MQKWIALAAVAGLLMIAACDTADTENPTVSIVFPADGATVNKGDILIKAVATDNKGVSKVEFSIGGTLMGTDNNGAADTFQYTWTDTAAQVVGHDYDFVAKAYDAAENTKTSTTVTITIAGGGGGSGPTHHSGVIPANETWYPSGNPHILDNDVYTGDNVTLTIMPGCYVQFSADVELYTGYSNPGSIIAVGTADSMITFTSLSDTVPGFWDNIGFHSNTISTARMSYCKVEFGGKTASDHGTIQVSGCNIKFDHNTVRRSGDYGVRVESNGYFADFSNNTITGCTKYPVNVQAEHVRTLGAGNTLTGNTKDGIDVDGGAISTTGTWLSHGVPYVIDGDAYVQDDATLTIEAGCTIALNTDVEFYSGYTSPGSIIAVGTATSPITFTSFVDTVPGIWEALSFYGNTISTARLSYCVIERAGGSGREGAVLVSGCRIKMDNCTVRQNALYGVYCENDGYFDDFSNNTITTSGEYPVRIDADKARTLGAGNVLTGNTNDGILVHGGNVATTGTWLNHGVPYVAEGDVYVSDETSNPVLTIAAGTTVEMKPQKEFYVGYSHPGGLIADGTAGQITFTSSVTPPSAGDWDRLSFCSNSISSQCKLKNCKVEYAGYDGRGNIYIDDCTPEVTGDSIGHSSEYGIYLDGSSYPNPAQLQADNTFYDNVSGDIRVPPK